MLTIKNQPQYKRLWTGWILCACALLLAGGCTPPGPRALLEGKRLMERGQYPQAIARLHTAVSLLRTNAQAYHFLGLACQYAGQSAEAEKAYRQAILQDPDLTEAHYNLGCLFFGLNRLDAARTEFLAYTLRRDNAVEGFLKLGTVELCMRETGAAERSFNEALRIVPQNPEALNGLALTRMQRGRISDSIRDLENLVRQQPVYPPALLNLAIILQQYQQDRAGALKRYQEYLALKPTPQNAEAVRAVVRQLEQELKGAAVGGAPSTGGAVLLASVRPAASASATPPALPKSEPIAVNSSKSSPSVPAKSEPAAFTNRVEVVSLPAEPVFKAAEDEASSPAAARPLMASETLSNLTAQAGESNKPVKRSFLQRLFGFWSKPAAKAAAPVAVDGLSDAEGGLSDAGLPAKPGERYPYRPLVKPPAGDRGGAQRAFAQGVQAQQANRLPEAIEAYRRAAQQDPAFFEAYYNLGLACGEAGQLRATLRAYETALMVRPASTDARYNFALALQRANYLTDAAFELEKILASAPHETRAHLALANLYAGALHEPARARSHYQRALKAEPHGAQAQAIRHWLAKNP